MCRAGSSPSTACRLHQRLHPSLVHPPHSGELACGLQWPQVDLPNKTIRFDMKRDDVMFFPINGELRAFLSSLPRATHRDHAPFVITYVDQQTKQRKRITTGGGGL
jgi:hypothetical protein